MGRQLSRNAQYYWERRLEGIATTLRQKAKLMYPLPEHSEDEKYLIRHNLVPLRPREELCKALGSTCGKSSFYASDIFDFDQCPLWLEGKKADHKYNQIVEKIERRKQEIMDAIVMDSGIIKEMLESFESYDWEAD